MRGQRAHMDRYGRYARIVGLVVRGHWEEIPALWAADDATGDNSFDAFVARQHLAHYLLRRIDTDGKERLFPAPIVAGLRRGSPPVPAPPPARPRRSCCGPGPRSSSARLRRAPA